MAELPVAEESRRLKSRKACTQNNTIFLVFTVTGDFGFTPA